MKFEVEVEATPAEARAFLGLPDLTPLHEAWVERMKSFSIEGPSADEWQKLMQTWAGVPSMAGGIDAWQKLMTSAMAPSSAKDAGGEKKSSKD